MAKGQEIMSIPAVPNGEDAVQVPMPMDVGDMLDHIQKRSLFLEKALPMAIAVTKTHEWTMFGQRPWPSASACEKIMERFGIQMINNKWQKDTGEDEQGPYYLYVWEADFVLPGFHTYHGVGTTTSRDKFFAYAHGNWKPLHEVPEDNILKAAQRLLLRSPPKNR